MRDMSAPPPSLRNASAVLSLPFQRYTSSRSTVVRHLLLVRPRGATRPRTPPRESCCVNKRSASACFGVLVQKFPSGGSGGGSGGGDGKEDERGGGREGKRRGSGICEKYVQKQNVAEGPGQPKTNAATSTGQIPAVGRRAALTYILVPPRSRERPETQDDISIPPEPRAACIISRTSSKKKTTKQQQQQQQ